MPYRRKLDCSKLNVTGVACVSAVRLLILIAWYEELRNLSALKLKDIHPNVYDKHSVDLDVIQTRARKRAHRMI